MMKSAGLQRIGVALLAAVSWPLAAAADHPTRYERVTSPGGLAFYHRFDEITPYAAVTFGWPIASETRGREGARAMLGPLLFNGVFPKTPSDYFERLADLHATSSINVSETAFSAEAKAPGKELPAALDLLIRAIKQGTPNERTFRRTKANFVNGEIQSATRAETQVYRAGAVMMLGDHPITRGFDPKRYETTTAADIAAWRKTAFTEGPLEIVVSGRIAKDAAGKMIDTAFAGWPTVEKKNRAKPALVAAKSATIAVATSGKQSVIQLQAPTREITGKDVRTAALAHGVLGSGPSSRLWQAVRGALGATYGASSTLATLGPDQRALSINAAVDPAQTDASIAALRKAYADWYETGITEVELRTQRERMISGFIASYRDPSAANRLILPLLVTGRALDDINDYEQHLASLTLEQVNTFIKERFPKPDELLQVVGTPEGTTVAAVCAVKSWQDVAKTCKP
jgi:zinc protease